jgi:hypothetical protein
LHAQLFVSFSLPTYLDIAICCSNKEGINHILSYSCMCADICISARDAYFFLG